MEIVLVVGGAGFIGSHTVQQLLKQNYQVVVVDDLSTGSKASLPAGVEFHHVDILNTTEFRKVFEKYNFSAIFHFAAKLSVPESFDRHFEYFDTNVAGTKNLLKLCEEFGVNSFVFSSTAAVYGNVQSAPVKESDALSPQNPYGLTKQMAELLVINQAEIQKDFKFRILRYFNVAGAALDGSNGPRNFNSGQLILNFCKSSPPYRKIKIFGPDYTTFDGSAVRDYIHVVDLADAHIEALKQLATSNRSGVWNCGYGKGYSVKQVVRAFENINKVTFNIQYEPQRKGDPAQVIANTDLIFSESNWRPKYNDIELICNSSYTWVKNGIGKN